MAGPCQFLLPCDLDFGARQELPICARLDSSQSHNAQEFETVTVYYRWHPLAGQKLIVHGRANRDGERVLCRLPDGSVCSLPAWILRPESSQFTLGKPLVSVDALRQLKDLLSTLQTSAGCDKDSLKVVVPKEGIDETAESKHTATAPVTAVGPGSSETAGGQTKRPRKRTEGTSSEGRRRTRREPTRKATR